jgi:hypothetical protein
MSVSPQVADYNDRPEEEEKEQEPYQVERIATILAVTCMFLSALYTIFAVLLFLCHAGEEKSILRISDGVHHDGTTGVGNQTPLISVAPGVGASVGDHARHHSHASATALGDGFITMDNSSQGTSE